jgi:hypothetical protein
VKQFHHQLFLILPPGNHLYLCHSIHKLRVLTDFCPHPRIEEGDMVDETEAESSRGGDDDNSEDEESGADQVRKG